VAAVGEVVQTHIRKKTQGSYNCSQLAIIAQVIMAELH
jgi:hypothetical protein